MHQPVNVYRNYLKQYLICRWSYRSQHDTFKKHGFRLKCFFLIFSGLIAKSKLIKQVWSCKLMWHCKCSVHPWIQSKIWWNVCENVKLWKQRVFIFLHSTVNLPAWRPEDKCYVNIFSPSVNWDSYSGKKKLFFKITWQMSKFSKSVRNFQHPILWRNHQNMKFFLLLLVKIWTSYHG